ncbi:MAG: hypothetical protein EOO16_27305, partial [Chitinophagaceae bacterium]
MKKTPRNLLLAALLLAACGAGAQQPPAPPATPARPEAPSTERKIRNFDDVQAELDRVQKQLDRIELRSLPTPPPPPAIDLAETNRALARAERELRSNEGMSRVDLSHARTEMARARREMARVQADLPRHIEEARLAQVDARRSMAEAGRSMEKARAEMKEYEAFENNLAQAGLIDKNDYKIEHRDGKLFLNDKEQPAAVYQKYRGFLDKHKKFTWRKS